MPDLNARKSWKNWIWNHWFAPVLALGIGTIYWPLIVLHPIINYDDIFILKPLFALQSLGDFWHFLFSIENPDVQPVRDFSVMLDFLIHKFFGLYTLHAQNLFIWFLSCCMIAKIFLRLQGDRLLAQATALLFALHPVFTMTVGWISGRKHLLAFFFLLAATKEFLDWIKARSLGREIRMALFFLLSVFSQPISVFWPLWCILFFYLEERRFFPRERRGAILFLLAIMLLCIYSNHHHYALRYDPNGPKRAALSFFSINPIGDSLLALGRYHWNIFVPWCYSVIYIQASWKNLAGLFGSVGMVFLFTKAMGWRRILQWLSLGIFSLALVLTKIPNIFVSDTYGIVFGFAWFCLVYSLIAKLDQKKWKAPLLAAFSALLLFCTARSVIEARQWQSSLALWEHAYAYDPGCFSSMNYSVQLLRAKRHKEAIPVIQFHMANRCLGILSKDLLALSIFYDPELPLAERIRLMRSYGRSQGEYPMLLLAALEISAGNKEKAREILRSSTQADPMIFRKLEPIFREPLQEPLLGLCGDSASAPCDEINRTLSQ